MGGGFELRQYDTASKLQEYWPLQESAAASHNILNILMF